MHRSAQLVLLFGVVLAAGSASAERAYYFHVTCKDGHEVIAKFRYGDIDPGRELAKVMTAQDFAYSHGGSCSASKANPADYPELAVEELKYRSTDGETIGRALSGDPAAVVEVVGGVGETVANDVTKGPGENNDLVGKKGWLRSRLGF